MPAKIGWGKPGAVHWDLEACSAVLRTLATILCEKWYGKQSLVEQDVRRGSQCPPDSPICTRVTRAVGPALVTYVNWPWGTCSPVFLPWGQIPVSNLGWSSIPCFQVCLCSSTDQGSGASISFALRSKETLSADRSQETLTDPHPSRRPLKSHFTHEALSGTPA